MLEKKSSLSKEALLRDMENNLKAEKKALSNYEKLSQILEDPEDTKAIQEIAQCEKKHIKIIEKLMGIVERNYLEA